METRNNLADRRERCVAVGAVVLFLLLALGALVAYIVFFA